MRIACFGVDLSELIFGGSSISGGLVACSEVVGAFGVNLQQREFSHGPCDRHFDGLARHDGCPKPCRRFAVRQEGRERDAVQRIAQVFVYPELLVSDFNASLGYRDKEFVAKRILFGYLMQ